MRHLKGREWFFECFLNSQGRVNVFPQVPHMCCAASSWPLLTVSSLLKDEVIVLVVDPRRAVVVVSEFVSPSNIVGEPDFVDEIV